jgi:hypothetical protein
LLKTPLLCVEGLSGTKGTFPEGVCPKTLKGDIPRRGVSPYLRPGTFPIRGVSPHLDRGHSNQGGSRLRIVREKPLDKDFPGKEWFINVK